MEWGGSFLTSILIWWSCVLWETRRSVMLLRTWVLQRLYVVFSFLMWMKFWPALFVFLTIFPQKSSKVTDKLLESRLVISVVKGLMTMYLHWTVRMLPIPGTQRMNSASCMVLTVCPTQARHISVLPVCSNEGVFLPFKRTFFLKKKVCLYN